jgi:hypothetical protein
MAKKAQKENVKNIWIGSWVISNGANEKNSGVF